MLSEFSSPLRSADVATARSPPKSSSLKSSTPKEELTSRSVCDIFILEYYLHQIIQLRLDNLGFGGEEEKKRTALLEAFNYATVISKLLGIINSKVTEQLEFDETTELRKSFAKFIGLVFFKVGRECAIAAATGEIDGKDLGHYEPCCYEHWIVGLKEAHGLFSKLLPKDAGFLDGSSESSVLTSSYAVFVDLKCQIIANELLANTGNVELLEEFMSISPGFNESSYLYKKLMKRRSEFEQLLTVGVSDIDELRRQLNNRFPRDLFEKNLRNFLKSLYASIPEPLLIAALSNPRIGEKEKEKEKVIVEEKQVTKRKQVQIIEPEMTRESRREEEVPLYLPETQMTQGTQAVLRDEEMVISGSFFRGPLEPNDQIFAAIADGTHPQVQQYLLDRKRKSASNSVRLAGATMKKARVVTVSEEIKGIPSLLERHNSAERIVWESQQQQQHQHQKVRVTTVIPETPRLKQSSPVRSEVSTSSASGSNDGPSYSMAMRRLGRRPYSQTEVDNLIEGVRRFGRDWRRILDTYEFNDRTNVDLKDKARNLAKQGLL